MPDTPNSQSEKPQPQDNKNVIQPDFILIDERENETQQTYFGSDSTKKPYEEMLKNPGQRPISLRLACFFGVFLAILFVLFMLFLAVLFTCLSLLSLFSNKELSRSVRNFWGLSFDGLIVGCCLVIGILSPPAGFGLIALYFSLLKKSKNYSFFQKVKKFF